MSITAAQWRKLACALPGVEEKSHFEQPDFRVRNKIFAGLDREETRGVLKLAPELQAMLCSSKPKAFVPAAGAWGRSGWTHVVLASVDAGAVPELLRESYRLVAPKQLIAQLDGKPARAKKPSAASSRGPSSKRTRRAATAGNKKL